MSILTRRSACSHLDAIQEVTPLTPEGCGECLKTGDAWVNLRLCLTCGAVRCCNDSPNKHAAKHASACAHPLVQSFQQGEDWVWCYDDDAYVPPRLVRAAFNALRAQERATANHDHDHDEGDAAH